ncbi:MAG: DUF1131 family protein [Parvibaculum sp.]|nr:DUF1131 family protein [Parvibaculum sp.]
MNGLLKTGLVCFAAVALYACSKPAEITVSDTGAGPITLATAFDPAEVGKLLPGYTVEAALSSALQPGEQVIRISNGSTPVIELYPVVSGKTVESALVLDASVKDDKGIHIGSTFAQAMGDADVSACGLGSGEKAGRVFCPRAGSNHIIYEFQGAVPAAEGQMPAATALTDWLVTGMLWDGSEPAP